MKGCRVGDGEMEGPWIRAGTSRWIVLGKLPRVKEEAISLR